MATLAVQSGLPKKELIATLKDNMSASVMSAKKGCPININDFLKESQMFTTEQEYVDFFAVHGCTLTFE